ncbi:hypothetical protein ABH940_006597 [Streptacidiphilus sp. BW17]|uniref:IS110 family transposase n=1 Tax=Streptacidiphilus sp. BW17 TaxID=3156274 RepID=UPI0035161714
MEEQTEEPEGGTVDRVAAIDIAKASGMVCVVPHETVEGRRVQQVWTAAATTNAIWELGDQLVCHGVQHVVMEATGTYWRPFFYLLEARGLQCWLVNARDVKNVPGRPKTDKLDAVWLAKLAERGMLRPSFVPPQPVRQLRDLTRTRTVFTQERTRHKHRVDKVLQDAQIKLSGAVSDLFGVTGRAILDALAAGERSPGAWPTWPRGAWSRRSRSLSRPSPDSSKTTTAGCSRSCWTASTTSRPRSPGSTSSSPKLWSSCPNRGRTRARAARPCPAGRPWQSAWTPSPASDRRPPRSSWPRSAPT